MKNKWLALVTLVAAGLVELPSPVVKTSNGLVRGTLGPGGKFYQFFSIPYGTVNESNRFQASLPPPKWDGVFNAIDENTQCRQKFFEDVLLGQVDCLKLYIYVPVIASVNHLLPVMVFIHGGCFSIGSGNRMIYGGDYFAEHGVILININYRLNVEGFLCLGIREAPGNAGLKDQIAALKWIKKNIKAFGGDPDNITLFGSSAGAASSMLLTLSKAAKGLFHKVITQSGSSLPFWVLQSDPILEASNLIKKFGYDTKDPYEIYEILSKKSIDELITAQRYYADNGTPLNPVFKPCVEKKIEGIESVIYKHPLDILKSGDYTKVPMIAGYVENEAALFVNRDYGLSFNRTNGVQVFQDDLVFPSDMMANETATRVVEHYLSENSDIVTAIVNANSDMHFEHHAAVQHREIARTNDQPLYHFKFKYIGTMNMGHIVYDVDEKYLTTHCDELLYMFRAYIFITPQRYLENNIRGRLITLWTNFAKYSDPTPNITELLPIKWLPSREANPQALIIDKTLQLAPMWNEKNMQLLDDIFSKYRRKDFGFTQNQEVDVLQANESYVNTIVVR